MRSRGLCQTAGGAGNLAVNLAALYDPAHCRGASKDAGGKDAGGEDRGSKVCVIGTLAKDQAGRDLLDLLTGSGCAVEPAYAALGSTTVKTRVTCGGQQILRIDGNDDWLSDEAEMNERLAQALRRQPNRRSCRGDYGKGARRPLSSSR